MSDSAQSQKFGYDDFTDNLQDRWSEWAINVDQDVNELALKDLVPSHPDLFASGKVLPYFERLRNESPVHYSEDSPFGPYWNITKHQHIIDAEKDFKTFSSESRYGGIQLGGIRYDDEPDPTYTLPMFIAMDPPKHDAQRLIVQPKFTAAHIQNMESEVRERVINILDSLPLNEPFNWVDWVSKDLTGQMLATLFAIPQEDRNKLLEWSDVISNMQDSSKFETMDEAFQKLWGCHEYFASVWQDKLKEPGDDLISMLAHGEATKDMPPNEYLGNLLLLIVGGNDTTRNSISGGLLALNQFPEEYDKLKNDSSLIPNMVSEMIRFQSPVAHMARTATRDINFHGADIKDGDRISLWYISGNRDDEVFDEPNQFKIDRENARRHVSFGFGIHRCLGNRLGEMQLRLLWEEIEKRFDRIEVLSEPTRYRSCFVHGITDLQVQISA